MVTHKKQPKLTTRKLSELVLDYDLYPRTEVDSQHSGYIREAIAAGAKMPPVVICGDSKRVIDGFHRIRAYRQLFGDEHEIACEERYYESDADRFLDAMRLNASHGRSLTRHDRARCTLMAKKFRLAATVMAAALGTSVAALKAIGEGRVASTVNAGKQIEQVPLKRTIQHMAGKRLTTRQVEANGKLSGMNQSFYANQLLLLIESDLIDRSDERLLESLRKLQSALDSLLAAV